MSTEPVPFEIRASQEQLDDLARRLEATRWPGAEHAGWELGTDTAWLRDLVGGWQADFDWRAQEAYLNSTLPGQIVSVRGIDLHFSHIRGKGPNPMPLLLLHGWPSSFVEMHRIVGPLTDPAAHGGVAEDCFDVVVGSIPGHGFSSAPTDARFGADEAADCFRDLMVEVLGYDRFAVHGGDRGAFVATGLAHRHAEHLTAIHQSMPMGILGTPPSAEEKSWLSEVQSWSAREGGYSAIQGTRPLSLEISPELVREPLDEIPADSTCISFLKARAERERAAI